jgi:hypothetical protein
MKKIITAIAFIALTTVSAKAIDFGGFSVTAGLANNTSVFGASGTESEYSETGTLPETNKEHGIFTDEFSSQFVELGIGQWVSVGYEMTSDPIQTPRTITNEGKDNQNSVQVDFNDLETQYVKINFPGGMFAKLGATTMDIKLNHTSAGSRTYPNRTSEGTSIGLGYQGYVGESGLGYRFETSYLEFDNVESNNGVATTGNFNKVEVTNMEGAVAKFAITYTLGRN